MKRTFTILFLVAITLLGSSAFINKSNSGYAGYTGSPGEATCSGNGSCHGGGSSAASGITITSVPAFSTNILAETEYMPDSTYDITISVSASGFSRYGFGCEILDGTNVNAGNIQNQGAGVKFLFSAGRKNAVHTTAKLGTSASFTFKWVAPSSGEATIYAIGNAVNGNGNTSGDFVIPPVLLPLVAAPTPTPPIDTSTVGMKELKLNGLSNITVFPNPATDLITISYTLKQSKAVKIELVDIKGVVVKQLFNQPSTPGNHSELLNLQGVSSGVYFIRTSANGEKASQKLITVQ